MKSLAKIAVFQHWPKLNKKDKRQNYQIWGCGDKSGSTKKNQKSQKNWKQIVNSCVLIPLFQPKSDDVVVTRALHP